VKLSIAMQTPEVIPQLPVALLSGSFTEKLEKAARWGAQGLELMTTEPLKLDWKEMRTLLASNGLEVCAIASGANVFALGLTLLNADPAKASLAKRRLGEMIDLAEALQAPIVTIGGFRGRLSTSLENGKAYLVDVLREASDYAEKKSVHLALEPLNRYENELVNNAAQGLEFLREVGHPALGLLLDTFHVNIEESSWTEPFRMLMEAGKLWHVHLGDNNRLSPGRGMIDFRAIVRNLQAIGYAGYLSAELLAKPDPDSAARETLEYMKWILAGLD
jgi:sugar phosphate isomerase/epimerase